MYENSESAVTNGKARMRGTTGSLRGGDSAGVFTALKDDAVALAERAGVRMRHAIDSVETGVTEATGNVTMAVREKPIQSSLIALGVGAIIGMLLRRS